MINHYQPLTSQLHPIYPTSYLLVIIDHHGRRGASNLGGAANYLPESQIFSPNELLSSPIKLQLCLEKAIVLFF